MRNVYNLKEKELPHGAMGEWLRETLKRYPAGITRNELMKLNDFPSNKEYSRRGYFSRNTNLDGALSSMKKSGEIFVTGFRSGYHNTRGSGIFVLIRR